MKSYITVEVTGLPQVRDLFAEWREALLRYGNHTEFCTNVYSAGPCDCGWDDIEARLTREDTDQ